MSDNSSSSSDSGSLGESGFDSASDSEAAREGTYSDPQGFGGRFGNSFVALLIGLLVVPISCGLLFWNEGRAVRIARALDEGLGIVVTAPTDRVDPAMNGKLVHVSGDTRAASPVADPDLGVSQKGLKLARRVEMFQWKESESGSGNDRKYSYSRVWDDDPISSSSFKFRSGHENPPFPRYRSQEFGAADAKIGAFPVGEAATLRLAANANLVIDDRGLATARRLMGQNARLAGGGYFLGGDPASPRVGDIRVTYKLFPEGAASFVGRQAPGGLEAYRATNGETFLLAGAGVKSSAELFQIAQDENRVLTWILRGVGLLLMFVGFVMLFAPVNLLASYVPILGNVVAGGIMLVAGIATLLIGPLVIAVAWFWYRPLVSLGVIAVGGALAFGLEQWRARRRAPMPGAGRPGMAPARPAVVRRG